MSQKDQNLYEGLYIIRSSLTDDVRNKAVERITNGITSRGGEVVKIHDWGKKRLAYEVMGQREGHYYVVYFKVHPSAITELKQEYRLHEDLLRYMTTTTDEVMEEIKFKSLAEA